MKMITYMALLLTSVNAFAGDVRFAYTQGPSKGKDPRTAYRYFNTEYNFCFVGDAKTGEKIIAKILEDDSEKASTFAKYTEKKDLIVFGYVDTKCTDEGMSDAECRAVKFVPRCRANQL